MQGTNKAGRTTILDKIVAHKKLEIKEAKLRKSLASLEQAAQFNRDCYTLRDFILDPSKTGIIAEFKRASPSKGIINMDADAGTVGRQYAEAGASAISVLTDSHFFGGKISDLTAIREAAKIPVLRKEFILDEYQIIEAKSIGADIILLIAAILDPQTIIRFSKLAKNLGLNVLLEVHNRRELESGVCDSLDAIGVNNRNLADFSVSIQHSYDLVNEIPSQFLKISESGISNAETINNLKEAGFNGFLIGENFMKEENPGKAIKAFVRGLK